MPPSRVTSTCPNPSSMASRRPPGSARFRSGKSRTGLEAARAAGLQAAGRVAAPGRLHQLGFRQSTNIVDSQVHIWGARYAPIGHGRPVAAKEAQKPVPHQSERRCCSRWISPACAAWCWCSPAWRAIATISPWRQRALYPDRFAVMGRLGLRDPASRAAGRRLEEAARHARHALHLPQRAQPAVPHRRLG